MVRRIPFCVSLPPCSMSSRRGLAMAELASMSERRPVLTTSARGGVAYPRSGRKNACSAVEQKNGNRESEERRGRAALTA